MKQRRCIFHYPHPIDENAAVGSAVRPLNMLKAFRESGYIVEEVTGYGKERKKKINEIKVKIQNGVKYDFVYSESLSMPTLLSEKNHFPKYPFLDFGFLKFCRKQGTKVGLFYRDIYWKFPLYKESVSKWIPYITVPLFKYDLRKYEQVVDVLYVPSKPFMKYYPHEMNWKPLPSGGQYRIKRNEKMFLDSGKLSMFYVGGLVGLYDVTELIKGVRALDNVELMICCPENMWEANKVRFGHLMTENIHIVHGSGLELEKFYDKAHVTCLYLPNSEYRDMAMPVKLFEYIGYGKPVIANSGTAVADYIKENDIGWVIDYDHEQLVELLRRLAENHEEVRQKTVNIQHAAEHNTWEARVKEIINDLT